MDPPPLPQPHAYTCSHCGQGWDEPRRYCPYCGHAQSPPAQVPAAVSGCLLVFLGLVALGLGGLGGCLAIFGTFIASEGGSKWDGAYWLYAAGGALVLLALFMLWRIVLMARRR